MIGCEKNFSVSSWEETQLEQLTLDTAAVHIAEWLVTSLWVQWNTEPSIRTIAYLINSFNLRNKQISSLNDNGLYTMIQMQSVLTVQT